MSRDDAAIRRITARCSSRSGPPEPSSRLSVSPGCASSGPTSWNDSAPISSSLMLSLLAQAVVGLGEAVAGPHELGGPLVDAALELLAELARLLLGGLGVAQQHRAVDRLGAAVGQLLGDGEVGGSEAAARLAGDQGDRAERAALAAVQRHAHVRAQAELAGDVQVLGVAGPGDQHRVVDLGDQLGHAAADHLGHAGAVAHLGRVAAGQLAGVRDPRGVDVGDRDLAQLVAVEQVHRAPVGDVRDRQPGDAGERDLEVERVREHRAGPEQEAVGLLDALVLVDVGVGPEPPDDRAVLVAHRLGAREVPAVHAGRVAQAELDLVGAAVGERADPPAQAFGEVLRVDDRLPAVGQHLLGGPSEVVEDVAVDEVEATVGRGGPQLLGQGLAEEQEGAVRVSMFAIGSDIGWTTIADSRGLTFSTRGARAASR
jgi:hypothetical protein